MELLLFEIALAGLLFVGVNWIGNHSVEFGYTSPTLFEDANESLAFNFVVRVLAPAVCIVAISAALVALGLDWMRLEIWRTICFYYLIRGAAIFVVGRQELVSWRRFAMHAVAGVAAGWLAYTHLILPQQSLFPDLKTAGNELWLAILAFLYAVANKVQLPAELSVRRRNGFVRRRLLRAKLRWSTTIDTVAAEPLLKLLIYAVIIYEDYSRPPVIRAVERHWPWPRARTTGIMQVTSGQALSDDDSVRLGADRLATSWTEVSTDRLLTRADIVWKVLAAYNKDVDYIVHVMEVMEIIAVRVDNSYLPAFEAMPDPLSTNEAIQGPSEEQVMEAAITAWIDGQPVPKPSRSEAVRQLIERGLSVQ